MRLYDQLDQLAKALAEVEAVHALGHVRLAILLFHIDAYGPALDAIEAIPKGWVKDTWRVEKSAAWRIAAQINNLLEDARWRLTPRAP